MVGGFVVPILLVAVWFAARGGLRELLEVHVMYASRVYAGGGLQLGLRAGQIIEYFWHGKVVSVALPIIALGLWALWTLGRRPFAGALVAWEVVAVACVALQNKWYGYHWIPLMPPLIIGGAAGLYQLFQAPKKSLTWNAAALIFLVVLAHAAIRPATYVAQSAMFAAGRMNRASYFALFKAGSIEPRYQLEAANYLRSRTAAGEGIAVWGCDALLPYLAERPTQFRLAAWLWPMATGKGAALAVRNEYRAEYITSLERTRPAFVIVNEVYGALEPSAALSGFPELVAHLAEHYQSDTTFGPLRLYHRNSGTVMPSEHR